MPIADPAEYLADVRSQLQLDWPANRLIRVVCHGHSVPAGYFKTPEVRMLDAYPHLLNERLCQVYPHAVTNVVVTAIGGENSVQGQQRFERDVLTLRPDVLTLDYGLNDRAIGLAPAHAAWSSMIMRAQAAGARVILLTPTGDTSAKLGDPTDPINLHAEQIRSLASGFEVGLVDSLALFKDYVQAGGHLADLMSQVNHPNRSGHELVARALASWFAAAEPG